MKPVISEELFLIGPDLDSGSAEEVIQVLCRRLEELDYIGSSYAKQVIQREKIFPTGLPTIPYSTAIPHADSTLVKHTGVAVAILPNSVTFRAMDEPEKNLGVRLVFLLAVADPSKQIEMLQWVSEIVQNQKVLEDLVAAETPHDGIEIIKPLINQPQSIEDDE